MATTFSEKHMKMYKTICFCGVAVMMWTDKDILINRLYQFNHAAPLICTIYFTCALVCMLLGVTASSFPDSAFCATNVAWNGALQASLFLNAFFHLTVMEFHPQVLHLTTSFLLTSVLFSIYWFFCA
ncbi:hypothetical protein BS78_05G095400 [Paspalum vaginatum]|nr:hypothetical protein BS78_05G095400 [Paspalum vaginatum]